MMQGSNIQRGGEDTTSPHSRERKSDCSDPAIIVNDLVKQYGNEDGVRAVDGISFEIKPGTAVGILGPNGAGKTTLIKCLLGLVIPSSGTVRIGGVDPHSKPKQAYRRIGTTLEGARNAYWRLSIRENLDFFAALSGKNPREQRDRHEQLLSQFAIENKANTVVRELSRGQKQKVSLACALARDANNLFLDEPTLGLDVESSLELQRELRRLVKNDETTVLISSHDMNVIEEVCDRVIIINNGEIVADNTIENLLRLFNVQQYEITIASDLSIEIQDKLQSRFDASGFDSQADQTRFRASVTGDEIYDLVSFLRAAKLSINSIETVESDMEHVFLKLMERENSESQLTEQDKQESLRDQQLESVSEKR